MIGTLLAIVAAGAILQRRPSRSTMRPRPNVVLIVIDTLRADYLGCYGFDGDISPRIDELAKESVLFEHCSSHAPWTTPSMASMMTRWPFSCDMWLKKM